MSLNSPWNVIDYILELGFPDLLNDDWGGKLYAGTCFIIARLFSIIKQLSASPAATGNPVYPVTMVTSLLLRVQ